MSNKNNDNVSTKSNKLNDNKNIKKRSKVQYICNQCNVLFTSKKNLTYHCDNKVCEKQQVKSNIVVKEEVVKEVVNENVNPCGRTDNILIEILKRLDNIQHQQNNTLNYNTCIINNIHQTPLVRYGTEDLSRIDKEDMAYAMNNH